MEELHTKVADVTAGKDEEGKIIVKDGDKTGLIDSDHKQFLEFSEGEITSVSYREKYEQVHKKPKKGGKLI